MRHLPEKYATFVNEYSGSVALAAAAFLISYFSLMYGAGSDPRYTLIVSQSILEHGTIRLEAYAGDEIWGVPADFDQDPNILEVGGHYYNYFPAGPSLLSLPFVAIANAAGWDMRDAMQNIYAQRLLSSVSVAVTTWLLFVLGRSYLDKGSALIISAVSVLGSTLISALGVALWSLNFSVVFIALSLVLMVRWKTTGTKTIRPALLGVLLFLAFFTRAAAAAFILPALVYLWSRDRRAGAIVAVSAALPLAAFLVWSRWEFGSWLPVYYSPARLEVERDPAWLALYGLLLSPSRGLLVYSPHLLLLIPGAWLLWKKGRPHPLAWLCLAWAGLHLAFAASATIWWGGHSFGPRILTEVALALALLTILAWREARVVLSRRTRRLAAAAFMLLGTISVLIHSRQGLYNYSTALWNVTVEERPAVPYTPPLGDLFNWRAPQFLASNDMLCRLEAERLTAAAAQTPQLATYEWGTPLRFDPQKLLDLGDVAAFLATGENTGSQVPAVFVGWEAANNDRAPFRVLHCRTATVIFRAEEVLVGNYTLTISAAAFGRQRAKVSLNGRPLGEVAFQQQDKLASESRSLRLGYESLQPHSLNSLTLELPDALRAGFRDPTLLSLAIESVSIAPS